MREFILQKGCDAIKNFRDRRVLRFTQEINAIFDEDPNLSKDFVKSNIFFERDVDKLSDIFDKISKNKKKLLTVSDVDGVIVPPFYRLDWKSRAGYERLRSLMTTRSHKLIFLSNRIELPNNMYDWAINTGVNLYLAGGFSDQMPLFLPKNVITKNSGYRRTPFIPHSDIMLNFADPNASISFVDKTLEVDRNAIVKYNYPKFQYYNKSKTFQRRKCVWEIFENLSEGGTVMVVGSSIYDREFLKFLLKWLRRISKQSRKKIDFSELFYLDSNLTFI